MFSFHKMKSVNTPFGRWRFLAKNGIFLQNKYTFCEQLLRDRGGKRQKKIDFFEKKCGNTRRKLEESAPKRGDSSCSCVPIKHLTNHAASGGFCDLRGVQSAFLRGSRCLERGSRSGVGARACRRRQTLAGRPKMQKYPPDTFFYAETPYEPRRPVDTQHPSGGCRAWRAVTMICFLR